MTSLLHLSKGPCISYTVKVCEDRVHLEIWALGAKGGQSSSAKADPSRGANDKIGDEDQFSPLRSGPIGTREKLPPISDGPDKLQLVELYCVLRTSRVNYQLLC